MKVGRLEEETQLMQNGVVEISGEYVAYSANAMTARRGRGGGSLADCSRLRDKLV